jgi:regulator of protease activity HflC (stomatin/prohibitin superfamily)
MKKLTNFINESNKIDFAKKITLKLENGVIIDAVVKVKDMNESFAKEQIIESILNQKIKEIIAITESEHFSDMEDDEDYIDVDNDFEKETFYIPYTSIFEYIPYDINTLSKAVENDEDVVSVHTEAQYGWTNQPEVVVIEVSSSNIKEAKERLTAKLEASLKTQWVRLDKKDW